VHVVGGSIGNVWALRLAALHPSRVGRVVLLGAGPIRSDARVPGIIRLLASPAGAVMVRLPGNRSRVHSILRGSGHGPSLANGRIPDEFIDWRVSVERETDSMGPSGSGNVEKVFNDYFASQGLATSPTAFDGRSDYVAFTDRGIPAGGIFAGAEGIKTAAEEAIYGGTAGEPYDPCYHEACDDISNPSPVALDQFSDAAADAVFQFAMTTSSANGSGKASSSSSKYEFKGSKLIR